MILIIMGVSGSGKTTIGKLLAEKLAWKFIEGDDYHSLENINKMKFGRPLNDQDRFGWLLKLRDEIKTAISLNKNLIISCSALKESYRKILKENDEEIKFIYLKGGYEEIKKRLKSRSNHFMKPEMLKSQFEALEEPANEYEIDIALSPQQIVQNIIKDLSLNFAKSN